MGRRRLFKIVLISAAAVCILGTLALWALIDRTASGPGLKPRVEAAVSTFLGRPVVIEALRWRRWPKPSLVATNLRVYEDPLKSRLLLDAPVVEARIAVLSVLKLAAGITELRLIAPRVYLRRDKSGSWNVVRLADEISARPDQPSSRWGSLAFNWFVIERGTVTIEDDAGNLAALSPLDVDGSGKLRFGRRHVHFPYELALRHAGSASDVRISGDLGGHARLQVDVKHAEPSLARFAWPPAARWSGRWDGSLQYDERSKTQWRVQLRAAPLIVSTSTPRLDLLEVSGDYVPSSSSTFSASARSSTTEIELKGSARRGAIAVDVKSPKADLETLWAFAGAAKTAASAKPAETPKADSPPASAAPWRLTATVSADDLTYGRTEFRAVRAVVSRSTGPYTLESLTFNSLGGSISASGSFVPDSAGDSLRFNWKAAGIDIQDFFRLLGSTRDAGGSADSEGSLVTGLGDRFLPAMNGKIKLDIKNGYTAMPVLLKTLSRLNLSTLFNEALGRHRQRVPYDEAHASVTVLKGKLSTDKPIVLQNKTLQIAFMGSYDLPSRTIDGKLVVNFLTVTDEIIGLIPGVREILLGKEKGLMPIWVEVKGSADDPKISVLSARTIAGPVWNTVRHILRLPKTLYKELKPSTGTVQP